MKKDDKGDDGQWNHKGGDRSKSIRNDKHGKKSDKKGDKGVIKDCVSDTLTTSEDFESRMNITNIDP